jgi:hypothetical protein
MHLSRGGNTCRFDPDFELRLAICFSLFHHRGPTLHKTEPFGKPWLKRLTQLESYSIYMLLIIGSLGCQFVIDTVSSTLQVQNVSGGSAALM